MACTTITVFFKLTGESIDVSVSPESTVEDIIKYVCDQSVKRAMINYDDYYLCLPNTSEVLANDETVKQICAFAKENFQFQLRKKTKIRETVLSLAIQKSRAAQGQRLDNQQIPVDGTQLKEVSESDQNASSVGSKDHSPTLSSQGASSYADEKSNHHGASELVPAIENTETNMSNPPSSAQSTEERNSELPKKLANVPEIFEEINIVLCGSPRVGKSALINAICQEELAATSAGLHSCTRTMSRYQLTNQSETDAVTISYTYNFWDTPGFENWTEKDICKQLNTILQKPKAEVLCLIYCASPGSHANLDQLKRLVYECKKRGIFCALVCTNKWVRQKAERDAVMEDFQSVLMNFNSKTREENGVVYFGNMGLCTAVNSQTYFDEDAQKTFERSGIDELMFGIMESMDSIKLAQWCTLLYENKSFWKNIFKFPKQFKAFLERLGLKITASE